MIDSMIYFKMLCKQNNDKNVNTHILNVSVNKSKQKNGQKLGKKWHFWAIFGVFDPFFVSKWAFLGKIVSLWPKTHFFL